MQISGFFNCVDVEGRKAEFIDATGTEIDITLPSAVPDADLPVAGSQWNFSASPLGTKTAKQSRATDAIMATLKAVGNPSIDWQGIILQLDQMVIQYGPQAADLIEQYLSTLNLSAWELGLLQFLIQMLIGAA